MTTIARDGAEIARTLFHAQLIAQHKLPVFTDLEPLTADEISSAMRDLAELRETVERVGRYIPFVKPGEGGVGFPTPMGAVLEIVETWLSDQRDACIAALETNRVCPTGSKADAAERRIALIHHYADSLKLDELVAIVAEWKADAEPRAA